MNLKKETLYTVMSLIRHLIYHKTQLEKTKNKNKHRILVFLEKKFEESVFHQNIQNNLQILSGNKFRICRAEMLICLAINITLMKHSPTSAFYHFASDKKVTIACVFLGTIRSNHSGNIQRDTIIHFNMIGDIQVL